MKTRRGETIRALRNTALLLGLIIITALAHQSFYVALHPVKLYSGWALMTVLLFLAAYNWRKRFPFLATLGSTSSWMQWHIYLGFFSVFLFFLHIGFNLPYGLELVMAVLYLMVALSGILGLWLYKSYPSKLTTRTAAGEVIFERIPHLRAEIRNKVEAIVLESSRLNENQLLANFYRDQLAWFFADARFYIRHLRRDLRPLKVFLDRITDLKRYLDDREQELADQLMEQVQIKYDLDYHYSLQSFLKLWLFVHVPFTYSLLLLSAFHGLAAHAFFGGSL